jgi:LmbE family N-acetylglucosaminyl deacetylase
MNVLVIAAHPDDEALGAGCAIARHAKAGDRVSVLFLTEGVAAREGAGASEARARRAAAERANAILGTADLCFENFPDNAMDGVPLLNIVKRVEKLASSVNPSVVYTHHAGDLNVDHKLAARAVITCFRPLPASRVEKVLAFDVPSATGWDPAGETFRPNHFLDATTLIDTKMAAIEAYAEEMRPFPHVRSLDAIRARATAWGTDVGLGAAEPFMLLREIVR